MGNPLHQATVAQEDPGSVVHKLVTFGVELCRQGFLGQGHTHRICQALPQWPRGSFHARCIAVLGVAGGFGVQLPEVFQVFDAEIVARKVQQAVQQHRAVTIGQYEPVPVGPVRVGRVVFQVVVPEHFGDIRHAHGGARVTAIGGLNSVHTQCSDGIGEFQA